MSEAPLPASSANTVMGFQNQALQATRVTALLNIWEFYAELERNL